MKKVLATALVALMVASTVFAGFSGSANVDFGYNFETGDYGFANGGKTKLEYNITSGDGAAKGERDPYAEIKGSMSIDVKKGALEVKNSIKSATVGYKDVWTLSILGSGAGVDFAASAIDVYGADDDPETVSAAYAAADGVEFTLNEWFTMGAGLKGNAKADTYALNGYIMSDDIELGDFTVAAGLTGSKKNADKLNLGFSAKGAYANDKMSASVATDLVFAFMMDGKDFAFDADVAANFTMTPYIALDVYYATKANAVAENLLSVKATSVFDPATITLTAKDLINNQDLNLAASVKATEEVTVDANVGYVIGSKKLSAGVGAEYACDDFTVGGNVGYSHDFAAKANGLTLGLSASTTALVDGATLSLTYGSDANIAQNLLDKHFGALTASCSIAF